jgi:hypothetical protein
MSNPFALSDAYCSLLGNGHDGLLRGTAGARLVGSAGAHSKQALVVSVPPFPPVRQTTAGPGQDALEPVERSRPGTAWASSVDMLNNEAGVCGSESGGLSDDEIPFGLPMDGTNSQKYSIYRL